MPELPDIVVYVESLERRIVGETLQQIRLGNPFLLRSVKPRVAEVVNRAVVGVRRMGKRIVIALEHDLFCVVHLMIAGRLRWRERGAKLPGKMGLAAFDFSSGTLVLTEGRFATAFRIPTRRPTPWNGSSTRRVNDRSATSPSPPSRS